MHYIHISITIQMNPFLRSRMSHSIYSATFILIKIIRDLNLSLVRFFEQNAAPLVLVCATALEDKKIQLDCL